MSRNVGVYVDLSNVNQCGGFFTKFDVLRDFSTHSYNLLKLNVYAAIDCERCKLDFNYEKSTLDFHASLRDLGYRVTEKRVKFNTIEIDGNPVKVPKSDADVEMAVDILSHADQLDKIVLVTGDGDFIPLVRLLQSKGKIVELIGFKNVSVDLKKLVDKFYSGYLIPDLIPNLSQSDDVKWGDVNSVVRGVCFKYLHDKSYGFIKYISNSQKLTDLSDPTYETIFVHSSDIIKTLNDNQIYQLPSRDIIFEFEIKEDSHQRQKADNIKVINLY